jgi:hypothetical protein
MTWVWIAAAVVFALVVLFGWLLLLARSVGIGRPTELVAPAEPALFIRPPADEPPDELEPRS